MKKYLFGLFAVALAIGFSAFSSAKQSKFVERWFSYNLDPTSGNFETEKMEPENYTLVPGVSAPCSSTGDFCGIKAELASEDLPDIGEFTDVHQALVGYDNGDGPETLIVEKDQ
jgi:hypothetical protein